MDLNEWTRGAPLAPVVFGRTVTFGVATAQERFPNELVKALQSGGYVLVMRHASSPREAPSKEVANADNTKLERQLDEAGRKGRTSSALDRCRGRRFIWKAFLQRSRSSQSFPSCRTVHAISGSLMPERGSNSTR
jgi:hypothetical protein